MPVRNADIRVNMKNAGFLAGIRDMANSVNVAGGKMGKAIAQPMKEGISSAKSAT